MKRTISDHEVELEQQVKTQREAVVTYLSATGHDLCHDQRAILAKAFGLEETAPKLPETLPEFADGCDRYQQQNFGACRTTQLQQDIQQLRYELSDVVKDNEKWRAKCKELDRIKWTITEGRGAMPSQPLAKVITDLFTELTELRTQLVETDSLRQAAQAWTYLQNGIEALSDIEPQDFEVSLESKALDSYITAWARQREAVRAVEQQRDHLARFKLMTHALLDDMGIGVYPGVECRIERRLAEVRARLMEKEGPCPPAT